jgi:HlyD family secretion protein
MTSVSTGSVSEQLGLDAGHVRLRHLKRWVLSSALVVFAAVTSTLLWESRPPAEDVEYVTQPITRGNLRVTITATGNLAPTNQVQVGSELSGIVKSVEVDYDERVRVGQVLARLDTTKLEAQINQTQAALNAARARVQQNEATEEEARMALMRAEELAARQLLSRSELDTARAAHKRAVAEHASAAAAVQQTEATLAAHRADLAKTTIRSPIDGVVLSRAIERGQTVAASFQAPVLFTLAEDLARMELDVDVDEADVGHVRAGQAATFTVDAYPDRSFGAHVAAVRLGSAKTEGVVTYKTVLYVDNSELLLRPGMTATAEIAIREAEQVVVVPNAALRFTPPAEAEAPPQSGGSLVTRLLPRPPRRVRPPTENASAEPKRQRVWILRDGAPVPILITVGATDGRVTEVTGGELQPGMALIVDTINPES